MKTNKKTTKIGLVGCGYWGPNLVRNFRQSSGCHLKMLCDASESRLSHMRRLYPDLCSTQKFEDLLNDSQLDAIVIATPMRFHYTMAKAALNVGKHWFAAQDLAGDAEQVPGLLADRLCRCGLVQLRGVLDPVSQLGR